MALTMSELSGLGQAPKKVLSVEAYNRFVREFGPNMAKDINLTWKNAPSSFYKQREAMIYREIASTPLLDIRVPSPRVTATRRYYDDGDLEEEAFALGPRPRTLTRGTQRERIIQAGRSRMTAAAARRFRPQTERGFARRSPVGAPFSFVPGERPGDLYKRGRGTLAERQRDQQIAQARYGKRVNFKSMEPLRTASATLRVQMREMAARGAKVVKPETWLPEAYDQRPLVASAQAKQKARLQALTKSSAGFRQMTNAQKQDYLTRMRTTFQGSAEFSSMLARYTKRAKRDRAKVRRQDRRDAWFQKDLLAVMGKRANPVAWEIRNEQARKRAAVIRARGELDRVRIRDARNITRLPGYDRIPNARRAVRSRVPSRAPGIPGIAPPPLPPRVASLAPVSRPVTGGGRVYGAQVTQARQAAHGRIVAGTYSGPMTYTATRTK